TLLTFGFASIVAPRYILPAVPALVLMLAVAITNLWKTAKWIWVRFILAGIVGLWLVTIALPFLYTGVTMPSRLPLTGADYGYYFGGAFNADSTTVQVAHLLDGRDPLIPNDPAVKVVYGDWVVCRLIYFYMQRPIKCLL